MLKFFLGILFLVTLSLPLTQGYSNLQIRFVGLVEDIKYVGQSDKGLFYVLLTDKDNLYTINGHTPTYFSVRDSVFEYWLEYQLSGVGKKDRTYFYPLVN